MLDLEDYGELLEDYESEAYDEAARPFRPGMRAPSRPVPTARSGSPVPQAASAGYATKADLQATAQRLDGRIAVNSKAIKTVDERSRTTETSLHKYSAQFRKEIADRKAATDELKKSLDQTRQISMLLPLLSTTTTQTVGGVPNVVVDSGDKLSRLLPILLFSGGFDGAGSGTGGLGGDNMSMLVLAIALSS